MPSWSPSSASAAAVTSATSGTGRRGARAPGRRGDRCRRRGPARRCAGLPSGCSRWRLTACGWMATYTSPSAGSAVTTSPPSVGADRRAPADTVEQVDADQIGDVARARAAGDLGDRPRLRDPAVLEHHEAIGQRDGVEQLVGHEDPRPGEGREVRSQVAPQLGAGTDVERGEGLVEQQQPGLGHERARPARPAAAARPTARLGFSPARSRQPDACEPLVRTQRGRRRATCPGCAARTPRSRARSGAGRGGSPGTRHRPSRRSGTT